MLESKQVGILYHFTKCANIDNILSNFVLKSHNGYISTTRNFSLADSFGDISKAYGYIIRLNLDGNKLSNKYKITPILGLDTNDDPFDSNNKNRINRSSGEFEELIKNKEVNIKDSLLSITVSGDKKCYEYIKSKHNNIEIIYDRKFKPIKEDVEFTFNNESLIIEVL